MFRVLVGGKRSRVLSLDNDQVTKRTGCEPRAAPPSEELDGLGEREGMTWQCSPLASKTPSQQRITCEGCRGPLCGVHYYKCQTCPEYVLCSACESRGDHDPHTMLRIDLSPRYSRELSDSDHTRYGACSEEWSTQGEVTRQKKPDKRYYLHVRSGGHYITSS